MAAGRGFTNDCTYTPVASATLPYATLLGTAAVRTQLFEVDFGTNGAPADLSTQILVRRCTSAGTAGSTPVAPALDPGDPAAIAIIGLGLFSVGPTLTAATTLLSANVNARTSYRWVAVPGKEIIGPATANAGLAFMTPVTNGTPVATDLQISWNE